MEVQVVGVICALKTEVEDVRLSCAVSQRVPPANAVLLDRPTIDQQDLTREVRMAGAVG